MSIFNKILGITKKSKPRSIDEDAMFVAYINTLNDYAAKHCATTGEDFTTFLRGAVNGLIMLESLHNETFPPAYTPDIKPFLNLQISRSTNNADN